MQVPHASSQEVSDSAAVEAQRFAVPLQIQEAAFAHAPPQAPAAQPYKVPRQAARLPQPVPQPSCQPPFPHSLPLPLPLSQVSKQATAPWAGSASVRRDVNVRWDPGNSKERSVRWDLALVRNLMTSSGHEFEDLLPHEDCMYVGITM